MQVPWRGPLDGLRTEMDHLLNSPQVERFTLTIAAPLDLFAFVEAVRRTVKSKPATRQVKMGSRNAGGLECAALRSVEDTCG